MRRLKGWELMVSRNLWYQRQVIRLLEAKKPQSGESYRGLRHPQILFSYSYTALEPFRWAKQHGWVTILGQIDPGIGEERLVSSFIERSFVVFL